MLGVAGAEFDPGSLWVDGVSLPAHGPLKLVSSRQAWVLGTSTGDLWHADEWSDWPGRPNAYSRLKEGDMVVRLHPPFRPSRRSHCVWCRACFLTSTRRL